MQNPDIARVFDEIADLLEIQDANPFRVRAYRNAARAVRDFAEPLAELVRAGTKDLTEIPGIGEDLAEKIADLVTTGEVPLRKQLAAKLPAGLLDLLRIPGLGPKRVKLLYKKLKVKSAADLAKVLEQGKIQKLKGFGPKIEEKIRAGLGQAQVTERRMLLSEAETQANAIVAYLKAGGGIRQIEVSGSYRRQRETIGDLDILVTSGDSAKVMDRFVAFGDVGETISKGETRATVKLQGGLQVDLRAVEPDAYGAALMYFTGSKAHNIELRKVAQERSYKLNEYGLFKGTRRVAGKTEAEVYAKLGLDWIPPELREARGEIELAREHRLPRLVELKDIRGDLQMHTSATDGKGTIDQMADAARELGYEYIAITDHSKRVTMALGFDAKRLREQWRAIDALNAHSRGEGFTILKSIELDILENGKLDLPDDVLAEADYVVATIHYGLTQSEKELTRRLVGAAEHPHVDAIGHPTGRTLGRRDPYRFDFDALCRACVATGCLLELNGHPERMDLPDTLAAAAKQQGVRFVLSTDSHQPGNLPFMKYAVALARRAGLEAGDILNTRPLAEFRRGLKRAGCRGR
ncbi:MAG TPA: DNA polymerase/3'-5' exonuclease PolX [Gemmatimonadales bacterium]|nr:DNA polymerase/3'-5' exonuclease PolX [Gemmatimonadales bacterium]